MVALRYIPESIDPTSVRQIDYPGVTVRTTLTVSLILMTVGALPALAVRGGVKKQGP